MLKNDKDCKTHKVLMGLGIIIFSFVLYMTSSETAINTNLNWSGAFFVLGVLFIIKALIFPHPKK